MKLNLIFSSCGVDNTCPSLFVSDDGAIYIQGYTVTEGQEICPSGEQLVKVNETLVAKIQALNLDEIRSKQPLS